MSRVLDAYGEDEQGYPRWDFEAFYQQGMSCHYWCLPAGLVKQAFRKACEAWKASGRQVALWQIRAFLYGCSGHDCEGQRDRKAPAGFAWPIPPDPSWRVVVCVYPDGLCDVDMVHAVSRAFWSEQGGFFALPTEDRRIMNARWFEEMGFEVFYMQPMLQVVEGPKVQHLSLVKNDKGMTE